MSNRLRMAMQESIVTLYGRGWSLRRIARELALDRETVARYVKRAQGFEAAGPGGEAKPAISTPGSETPKPAISTAGRKSVCESYRAVLEEKLTAGLTAQRIFQDLVLEQGFSGSYSAVKRYVRRVSHATPLPFRRMEGAPGAEAQIDFGPGVAITAPDGKRRRTYVLRIVLSHSRKGYSEACLRQTTDDLIRCLENAFWSWGGVPKTLVPDNLKAAVTQADWYDPELNPKLHAFCRHYGTVLLPCKPCMPRHKGKVESDVKCVSRNALAGHAFGSLGAHNEHLCAWEERIADQRIHGTTKRQVREVFETAEREALLPLPAERFPFFHEAVRIVHRDAHIEVAKAYYSVPPEYLGRSVWVRWDERLVRIFNRRWEQIALHARAEPGRFHTDTRHLAAEKISAVERGADELLRRARRIGPQTGRWGEEMLKHRGVEGVRVLVGLLALARRHGSALESVCEVAAGHGVYKLRVLRALLKRRPQRPEVQLTFLSDHPLIRRRDDYGTLVRASFRPGEHGQEPTPAPIEEEQPTATATTTAS